MLLGDLSIRVAVADPDGQGMLMVRRAAGVHAGCWKFPGGIMQGRETVLQAAAREVMEETQLRLTGLGDPFATWQSEGLLSRVIVMAVLGLGTAGVPRLGSGDNLDRLGHFNLRQALELPAVEYERAAIVRGAEMLRARKLIPA